MNEQAGVFQTVLAALEQLQIVYMITGSVASVRYGEPRMTLDMDVILDLTMLQARRLARCFGPDYYADEAQMTEAIQRRSSFNIIHGASGTKVDCFVIKDSLYDRQALKRRRCDHLTESFTAYFTSPEDNILGKLLYYREGGSEKHLRDIRGILRTMKESLDMAYLDRCAVQLGVSDVWDVLKQPSSKDV